MPTLKLEQKLKIIEKLNEKPEFTTDFVNSLRALKNGKKQVFPSGDDGWSDTQLLSQSREVRNKALIMGVYVERVPPSPPAPKKKTKAELEKEAFAALTQMTAEQKKAFKEDIDKAKSTAAKRKRAAKKARAAREAKAAEAEAAAEAEKKN